MFEFASLEGDQIIHANAHSKLGGWTVGVAIKKSELEAIARRTVLWSMGFAGVVSLISLLLAWRLARSIVQPIASLGRDVPTLLADPAQAGHDGPPEIAGLRAAIRGAAADRIVAETARAEQERLFRGFFETAAVGTAVLEPGGRFLESNGCLLEMTGHTRQELATMSLSELSASPQSDDSDSRPLDEAVREPSSTDVCWRRKDGTTIWVQASLSPLRDASGRTLRIAAVVSDITERKRSAAVATQLAAIVSSSSDAILSRTLDGIITSWNTSAARMFGYRASEIVGQSIRVLVPAELEREEDDILTRTQRGEPIQDHETVRLHKDGRRIEVSITLSPLRNGGEQVVGVSKIIRDITVRKQHERRIELLLREVNHRSKNMLALVQAVAAHSARSTPEDFLEAFTQRLSALTAGHDLLIESDWRGVELGELVRATLDHFRDLVGSRIVIAGPPVQVNPKAAQTIGMALHELATNASKYGALSSESGVVDIHWAVCGAGEMQRFVMSWSERGGPPLTAPRRRGFGSTVIVDMPRMSLAAEVELAYQTEGLRWRLEAPLRVLTC